MARITLMHLISAVTVFVSLCMLVVLLGGVAALEDDNFTSSSSIGYIWWCLFFQLFVILAYIGASLAGILKRLFVLVAIFMGMSTVVCMQVTDTAVQASSAARNNNWSTDSAWGAVAAGALVNVVVNFLLLAINGMPDDMSVRGSVDVPNVVPPVPTTTVETHEMRAHDLEHGPTGDGAVEVIHHTDMPASPVKPDRH